MSKVRVVRKPRVSKAKAVPAVIGLLSLPGAPTQEQRRAMVSEAAYYRAQKRGFEPGRELDDWLAAEAEIGGCSPMRDLQSELH